MINTIAKLLREKTELGNVFLYTGPMGDVLSTEQWPRTRWFLLANGEYTEVEEPSGIKPVWNVQRTREDIFCEALHGVGFEALKRRFHVLCIEQRGTVQGQMEVPQELIKAISHGIVRVEKMNDIDFFVLCQRALYLCALAFTKDEMDAVIKAFNEVNVKAEAALIGDVKRVKVFYKPTDASPIREEDAIEMSTELFQKVKWGRNTPDYVLCDGVGYHNSYTCLSGYDGTCNCFSHPRKQWDVFNPETGEVLCTEEW